MLYKSDTETYSLVDGQQRVTTATLLLCALRDAFENVGKHDLAAGLHQYIERPDDDNQKRIVLYSESSYPFMQSQIQKIDGVDPCLAKSVEEVNLASAFKFVSQKVDGVVQSVELDSTISAEDKLEVKVDKLRSIREQILHLTCVLVVLESEDDAYVIFETLNTRGKDLMLIDLVRTYLTKMIPKTVSDFDQPKEKLDDIRQSFDESSADIDADSFMLHFWLSNYDFAAKKNIYKELKRSVRRPDARGFLKGLVEDARRYRQLSEPDFRKWKKSEDRMRSSLEAFNLFRIQQSTPFSLSILRAYDHGKVKIATASSSLEMVENFHFCFTAVTSQRSSGGISQMYALHARQVSDAKNSQECANAINDLKTKLRQKVPPFEEFLAGFRELRASERFSSQKKLVSYMLHKLFKYRESVVVERHLMTLEHLAPQSGSSGLSEEVLAKVGNLTWVPDSMQNALGKKSMADKLEILTAGNIWVDDGLAGASETWGPEEIEARTEKLARIAYEEVWTV